MEAGHQADVENSRKPENLETDRCKQGVPSLSPATVVGGPGGGRGRVSVRRARLDCLPRADPPPVPRISTTIVPRALLNPSGACAEYLKMDDVDVAPIRARLRLCSTRLAEHQELRHVPILSSFCRLCNVEYESVAHVLFSCSELTTARSAARAAARAVALDLDLLLIAGVVSGTDHQTAFSISSALLLAIRKRIHL